jgi:DNA-binding NtrC family response regulator
MPAPLPESLHSATPDPVGRGRLPSGATELVGRSPAAARVQELVRQAASRDSAVLIVAERGAQLLPVARELHRRSLRGEGPFVEVECAASDTIAELFGCTPADPASDLETISVDCRVAAARGGTLFLRDIIELPAAAQGRLARIMRDREVRVAGEPVATELRIIATASPEIEAEVHANRFRPDLYRRVTVQRIDLPPLRERAADVPALAARLLEDLCATLEGTPLRKLSAPALSLLAALNWPGNLDELHESIGRIVVGTSAELIEIEHVLPALRLDRALAPFVPAGNLREARVRFERDYIAAVLQHHGWRIAEAAQTLGIQRPNLYRKARQLGIPLAPAAQ